MFKKENDNINKKIINMNKSKLDGKYQILNNILSKNEYIYKDVSIDEIDENIIQKIYKKDIDMSDIHDICFNINNKMPYCKKLKEGFQSLDNITIDYNKTRQKYQQFKIQNINKTKYYSNYYNNEFKL